ncbi:hypothetical protein ACLI1A_15615 [Flavobacterium sp. RHBU_3]|uniref:hypothetical protein n=1 Tax=Flavobacterium sp. RHBU_3 TaxID=3391184 RepID=UPI003984C4A3
MASYRQRRYNTQKSPIQRFLFVLGALSFIIYIAMGYLLIFTDRMSMWLTYNGRLGLGIIVVIYGILRLVRAIQKYKEDYSDI